MKSTVLLKIDGVMGESEHSRYPDHIRAIRYQHVMNTPSMTNISSGIEGRRTPTTAGQATFHPIKITKPIDSASTELFKSFCHGRPFTKAECLFLRFDRTGNERVFYRVVLTEVTVVGIEQLTAEPDDHQSTLIEVVDFAFGTFEAIYGTELQSNYGFDLRTRREF